MEVITGTIGYGVVGSGYFGAELARIMNTKQGAQIRAVYDPENGGPVAAELGCDAEDSLESLVSRKDIQAVIVAIICTRSRCWPRRSMDFMCSAKSPSP